MLFLLVILKPIQPEAQALVLKLTATSVLVKLFVVQHDASHLTLVVDLQRCQAAQVSVL